MTGTMIEGLAMFSGLLGGLLPSDMGDLTSNTSLMFTISPPLLESSSIRSSRLIGLLKMFLGPDIWTLDDCVYSVITNRGKQKSGLKKAG